MFQNVWTLATCTICKSSNKPNSGTTEINNNLMKVHLWDPSSQLKFCFPIFAYYVIPRFYILTIIVTIIVIITAKAWDYFITSQRISINLLLSKLKIPPSYFIYHLIWCFSWVRNLSFCWIPVIFSPTVVKCFSSPWVLIGLMD